MIRPLPFLLLAALLLGATGYLAYYVPPGDPFSGPANEISIDLTTVPAATTAELKLRHAQSSQPADIGLFGNSRILSVSAHDLGLPDCRFFNFALSGESIRASVALIEKLAAIGKAPRIAVVGIDNYESQYFGNPMWPAFAERWRLAGADIAAGWSRTDVSMVEWLRMGWRHLHTESQVFRYLFERHFFVTGISLLRHRIERPAEDAQADRRDTPHYRLDGSLSYDVAGVDEQASVAMASAPEQVMIGYLRRDLQRLADQQTDGRRVIVYESPVAPASARRFAREPSAHARRHREVFLEECRRLGLACRPDPGLFGADAYWRDASHPPPQPLGAYIRSLISGPADDGKPTVCGDDL